MEIHLQPGYHFN